jgi:hypothetical protein
MLRSHMALFIFCYSPKLQIISPVDILSKYIYINKTIFIMQVTFMVKKEVLELYKDAIITHLVKEGMNQNRAEAIARRRMTRDDEL